MTSQQKDKITYTLAQITKQSPSITAKIITDAVFSADVKMFFDLTKKITNQKKNSTLINEFKTEITDDGI